MTFLDTLRATNALAVFGDSITVGLNASAPRLAWPLRLARSAGISRLDNHAISGTILQGGLMADGEPRPDNGIGRYRVALLGSDRCDAVAILYGYNDARYTGAPDSLNSESFRRDYAAVITGLLEAGFAPARIAVGSPPFPSDRGFAVGSTGFTGQSRAGFERYVAAVRLVAEEFGLPYAAVYEAMAACPHGSLSSPDVTHPNDDGHRVIAMAFADAV
ncbi:MAG TPA: SGNH/GDSL hydrolase family protein [Devosiaceae bacterium]|jgi:lysophospholipase L1-like esterase